MKKKTRRRLWSESKLIFFLNFSAQKYFEFLTGKFELNLGIFKMGRACVILIISLHSSLLLLFLLSKQPAPFFFYQNKLFLRFYKVFDFFVPLDWTKHRNRKRFSVFEFFFGIFWFCFFFGFFKIFKLFFLLIFVFNFFCCDFWVRFLIFYEMEIRWFYLLSIAMVVQTHRGHGDKEEGWLGGEKEKREVHWVMISFAGIADHIESLTSFFWLHLNRFNLLNYVFFENHHTQLHFLLKF